MMIMVDLTVFKMMITFDRIDIKVKSLNRLNLDWILIKILDIIVITMPVILDSIEFNEI